MTGQKKLLLNHPQRSNRRFLRDAHVVILAHTRLARFLLFQQFSDVAAIVFCGNVVAHGGDGLGAITLRPDGGLDRIFNSWQEFRFLSRPHILTEMRRKAERHTSLRLYERPLTEIAFLKGDCWHCRTLLSVVGNNKVRDQLVLIETSTSDTKCIAHITECCANWASHP